MSLRIGLHTLYMLTLLLAVLHQRDAFAIDISESDFEPWRGRVIEVIDFRHSTNLQDRDLARQLPLALGDRLDRAALDRAVAALYERAVFEHVDVELISTDQGVEVHFLLVPITRISGIEFDGAGGLDLRRLRGATGQRSGNQLSLSGLLDSVERLQRYLRDRGYFNASVSIKVVERLGTTDVTLRYMLRLRERASITEVSIDGETPEQLKALQQAMTDRFLGNAATKELIRTFAQELRAALRNAGYWQASVRVEDTVAIPPDGARVTLRVNTRDPFTVQFEGNEAFSERELLEPLQIDRRNVPFTAGAVASFCTSLEERYQRRGYLLVQIRCDRSEIDRGSGVYTIRIIEGEQYTIRSIEVTGAEQLGKGRVRNVMETGPAKWWLPRRFSPGYLVLTELDADVERIRSLYREEGFRSADVRTEYRVEPDHAVVVSVLIEEGEQDRTREVTTDYVGTNIDEEIRAFRPDLEVDQILTETAVVSTAEDLKTRIADLGYPNVRVDQTIKWDEQTVHFAIDPGMAITVDQVLVKGNRYTHDRVLRRAVGIRKGDRWSPSEISQGSSALARTGLFREVSVEPQDGLLDSENEVLLIEVDERETGVFDLGVALDTQDGLHLTGEVGQRNLGGRGESLTFLSDLYLKPGGQLADAGRIRALYHLPSALGRSTDLYTELFAQFDIETIEEYSFDRIGALPTIRSALSEHLTSDVGVMVFQERLYDVSPDVIISSRDTGDSFYSLLRGQLDLDYRDDRYNPRRGSFTQVQGRFASKLLGSEVELFSIGFQQALYTPLSTRLVWSNSLRGNMVRGFGDTDVVPLSQRIYLGGRNSLRGFSRNKIGPRGVQQGIAGGDSSVVYNTELQYDFIEDVIGVLFLDVGQSVLVDKGSFDGDPNTFSDLRYSPGFGVRYRTPIGPLSVEYGFALDREFGERFGRLSIGIGNAW